MTEYHFFDSKTIFLPRIKYYHKTSLHGLTLTDDRSTCAEVKNNDDSNSVSVSWATTPIREDKTIRPHYNGSQMCFYHKMNGFTPGEKIYVGDCALINGSNRYHWIYFPETGLITNRNRMNDGRHCIAIPDWSVTKKKQQLQLDPCDAGNPGQSWIVENGMIKVRANRDVCVMWNLGDKTRLWTLPCGEHIFAPLVFTGWVF